MTETDGQWTALESLRTSKFTWFYVAAVVAVDMFFVPWVLGGGNGDANILVRGNHFKW